MSFDGISYLCIYHKFLQLFPAIFQSACFEVSKVEVIEFFMIYFFEENTHEMQFFAFK